MCIKYATSKLQAPSLVVLGWVSQLMGWVGSGHTKWTHGQLCTNSNAAVHTEVRKLESSKSNDRDLCDGNMAVADIRVSPFPVVPLGESMSL